METNLAVLIDFENIAAGTQKDGLGRFDVELVLARLSDKGRVLIARSYADWGRFARFKQGLLTNNVSMMELTSHGMQDKNRADIALVVEGMELAFTKPYIDTFVIVSGDSDFTPLVLKMRELDKRVIGCGCRSSTSRLLIQACDEFIFYDNLVKRKESKKAKGRRKSKSRGGEPNLEAAFELLTDALEGLQRENPDPALAGVVKSAMLRKSPDFSESDLGFSTFGRFLEKARKEGHVTISRDEKSGGYRVDQPNGVTTDDDADGGKDKGSRGGSRSRSDDGEDTDGWLDPYLPEGTADYVRILADESLNPLAAPTRNAILQLVEEIVEARDKKRRRVTVQFVQDDVRRRIKKTHPDLPRRAIRQVFNALMRAAVFIHRDGTPVRTGSAPFTLNKTAEELNETLADIYVDELIRADADLDPKRLADLFFGDPSHTRPVEESIAYHQAQLADDDEEHDDDEGDEEDLELDLDDADSLLVEDDEDDDDDEDGDEDDDDLLTTDDDDGDDGDDGEDDDGAGVHERAAEALAEVAEAAAQAEQAGDEDDGDDKPRKRRVRRRRKPKASSDDDLDALLSED